MSTSKLRDGEMKRAFDEKLGANIWRKRTERGLSRQALGVEIGAHRNMIERWEKGEYEVSIWMLMRIADKLSVNHLMLLPDRDFTWGRQFEMAVRERDLPLTDNELRIHGMKL